MMPSPSYVDLERMAGWSSQLARFGASGTDQRSAAMLSAGAQRRPPLVDLVPGLGVGLFFHKLMLEYFTSFENHTATERVAKPNKKLTHCNRTNQRKVEIRKGRPQTNNTGNVWLSGCANYSGAL